MIVTEAECRAGALAPDRLQLAEMELRDAGVLTLQGVLPPRHAASLHQQYQELVEAAGAATETGGLRRSASGENHFQLKPPLDGPFGDPGLVANPIAVQCMRTLLGEDMRFAFYNSNLAAPGSGLQTVHRDSRPLFGTEFESPPPAHMLVANILLCDFTVENGSTEVWPGSHLLCDTYQGRAHPLDLEERARYLPSRRLNAPAGSIVLRDLRLWHRGTPNRSGANRSMLSPVYRRSWLGIAPAEVPPERLESWAPETRRLFDR